uniref:Ephrin (inferred by orthology to a D. melanogaster protein) n=1 Tax=Anisakis simplex TaxID=6269 RepID=A0A0M3IYZ7_ANISI
LHDPADIDAEKMDSLVIHCPTFDDHTPVDQTEQMIIYRVSQFGYENCVLDETAKVVGRCADPYLPLTIRTVFRQFTPLPSGLEYSPGNTYYFVSTSDGTAKGIGLTAGGLCLSKQLRLRVHIHATSSKDAVHGIRHHGHHRAHNTMRSRTIDSTVQTTQTPPPRYWDEFLNKLNSKESASSSWNSMNDYSSSKWQPHPSSVSSSSNQIAEALSLDNTIDDYHKGLEYERDDSAVSEALRIDPNFKLFEIHEIDDYNSMPFSSSHRLRPSTAIIILLVVMLRRFLQPLPEEFLAVDASLNWYDSKGILRSLMRMV